MEFVMEMSFLDAFSFDFHCRAWQAIAVVFGGETEFVDYGAAVYAT